MKLSRKQVLEVLPKYKVKTADKVRVFLKAREISEKTINGIANLYQISHLPMMSKEKIMEGFDRGAISFIYNNFGYVEVQACCSVETITKKSGKTKEKIDCSRFYKFMDSFKKQETKKQSVARDKNFERSSFEDFINAT